MLLRGIHDEFLITITPLGQQVLATGQVAAAQKKSNNDHQESLTTATTSKSKKPTPQVPTFVDILPPATRTATTHRLDAFLVAHVPHRPVALVSSGGTAVDLEQNTVRTLENFSTGWRGAVAVEGLLRQGYAVIHLQRTGSTSPFGRILMEECGSSAAHQGLSLETMDRLVGRAGHDDDDMDQGKDEFGPVDDMVAATDPFLTDTHSAQQQSSSSMYGNIGGYGTAELHLRRTLVHSSRLQKAVRERYASKGRLLTIPFRTVQEYLALVELSTTAVQSTAGAQALLLLAAAVSDFYVPKPTQHKIQSGSLADDGLVLELQAVPKTLGILRTTWAPDAFMVSFKLETDESILQHKAQQAMKKYGVHLVVGNLLQTRYDQVHLLLSDDEWVTLDKPPGAGSDNKEALEELILQAVVEAHFAYMAGQGPHTLSAGLRAKQRSLQRRQWWQRGRQLFWEMTGVAVSLLLSYGINRLVLQQPRIRY